MEQNNITICGQDLVYESKCCCGCQDEDKEKENIFDNIEIDATVDNTTGEPSVTVVPDEENNKYTFVFTGLKGETGDPGDDAEPLLFDDLTEEQKAELKGEQGPRGPQGNTGEKGDTGAKGPKGDDGIDGKPGTYPNITAHADIGNTVGNPSVRVTVDGEDPQNPVFNFYFDGIKGPAGANGTNGTNGRDGRDGIDGKDGEDGKDGIDAKAEDIENAVIAEVERQLDEFDDLLQAAEWLKYAIDGHENDKEAFARLIAAARQYDSTGKNLLQEAYSGVNALVTKGQNGEYTATSFLMSLIGTGDSTITSGIITTSNIDEAVADVFAEYNTNSNNAVARIFALANRNGSTIKLKADLIDLDGETWAQKINLDSALDDAISTMTSNTVTLNSNGVAVSGSVTGGSTGNVVIGRNEISLRTTNSTGTVSTSSSISSSGFTFPQLSYSSSDSTLNASIIDVSNTVTATQFIGNVKANTITTEEDLTITSNSANGSVTIDANDVYLRADNTITANPTISSSDERIKNVTGVVNPLVEDIANTRTVNYEFKDNVGKIRTGAIAQDWQSILPNAVKTIDADGHLGLDYSSAALVSAVIDAREIVKLKQENAELKQRLAAIEARLA